MDELKLIVAVIVCFATAIAYWRRRSRLSAGAKEQCYLLLESKPQNSFKRVLADNSYGPFIHLRRHHGTDEENNTSQHPYEAEINRLLEDPSSPPKYVSNNNLPTPVGSHIWVATRSKLEDLADLLSKESVFAVDTEQHSLRSFLGFTALLQISTESQDYLVDVIALHDEMHILRPIFADPSICKLFHGADNDVLWLQRDFHIYVVNLFDTAKACDVLSKPFKSLAYLLETYCGVTANKLLQREDWRQRPLSAEMVEYAITDAHYLLYIADCLVKELEAKGIGDNVNFLSEASRRSNMVCLQLFAKDTEASLSDSAAAAIFLRYFGASQGSTSGDSAVNMLLRKLCIWRDLMARIHDESLRYVLSDQAIAALAYKVPKDPKLILDVIREADLNLDSSMINSTPSPSPFAIVCSHVKSLLCLLLEDDIDSDVSNGILQDILVAIGTCARSAFNDRLLSKYGSAEVNRLLSKQKGGKLPKNVSRKVSRELFIKKFSCKSPVYHNCRIFASDGRLLCYCDRRKLEWYVQRDLARLVDEDPPAIMLLFEPKGRPEDEGNDFYVQSKKNICVGCGERGHYIRYRIIPSCYRMHFPEHLKSHRSHDIVLLCVDCHEIAHSAAERYKRQVAKEFGVPLYVRKVVNSGQNGFVIENSSTTGTYIEGVSPLHLRTAAIALLRHGSRMPIKRREELAQIVQSYFGGREITDEDLEAALLVGMSPHERRRLEKKRGLSLKSFSKKSHDFNGMTSEDRNFSVDLASSENACQSENGQAVVIRAIEENMSSANKNGALFANEQYQYDSKEQVGKSLETAPPVTTNNKLSLLGHGPHGKQVVDLLLEEYGEDGIRQFCQQWRQVFVEAVRPRFLPVGWDIMHSGRREFGEYSVYNPANRAHNAVML